MSLRARTWIGLGLLAALWLAPNIAWAQDTGAVSGRVIGPRGEPARVSVVVRHVESGIERRAVSQPDGTFAIGRVPAGANLIVIEEIGYVALSQPVTVLAGEALTDVEIRLRYSTPDYAPVTDRWRLRFPRWERYPADPDGEYPFVPNRGIDPYDQNVLKGDLPIVGDSTFLILTGVFELPYEHRLVPTPSGVSTNEPAGEEFFGGYTQYATLPTGLASVELFHGSTAFKPRDWAVRITPVFNLNYVHTEENNVLDVSPEQGPTRTRHHLALQEAFGEVKLLDVGEYFDFASVRAGIQPFNSDFRGFLFRDTNFGIRAFGTWGRTRNQWNVAWFDQLEKETNSELNLLERRDQRVFIANYYRQDFLTEGYTISGSFHANIDRGEEIFFDENGFLVRPSPVGFVVPHEVKAYYLGVGGDGHLGRLNLTHQFYQAFGEDGFNGVSGRPVDINAQFVALELSVDRDWLRPRIGFVFASGDDDPDDEHAKGFDAIVDDPNIAGGQFSFWSRQSIRLAQTGVALVGRDSVLPSLRSSKSEGQASFVNPGIIVVTGGLDAQLTTKMRMTSNVNYLRFHRTEVLRRLLFQDGIEKSIGLDASIGIQYRPALNDNLILTGGASILFPGRGFKEMLTDRRLTTVFLATTFTY